MATYDALLVDDNVFTSQVIGSGEFGEVKSARAYVQRGDDESISAELDPSKLERDESGEWHGRLSPKRLSAARRE